MYNKPMKIMGRDFIFVVDRKGRKTHGILKGLPLPENTYVLSDSACFHTNVGKIIIDGLRTEAEPQPKPVLTDTYEDIHVTVSCADEDPYFPATGISECFLKIVLEIEAQEDERLNIKRKENKEELLDIVRWGKFKRWAEQGEKVEKPKIEPEGDTENDSK